MKLLDIKEKIWLLDDENFNFPTLEQMGGDLVAIGGDFHPQDYLMHMKMVYSLGLLMIITI